ncbi:hypothetical protein PMIN06_012579 [Paraphaeosphaeria minitans]
MEAFVSSSGLLLRSMSASGGQMVHSIRDPSARHGDRSGVKGLSWQPPASSRSRPPFYRVEEGRRKGKNRRLNAARLPPAVVLWIQTRARQGMAAGPGLSYGGASTPRKSLDHV